MLRLDAELRPLQEASTMPSFLSVGVLYSFISSQTIAVVHLLTSYELSLVSPFLLLTIAYLVVFVLSAVFVYIRNLSFCPAKGERLFVITHSIFHSSSAILLNCSLSLISAFDATIFFDTNLVLAAIFSFLILHEPLDLFDIISIITSLFGVILWCKPDIFTSKYHVSASSDDYKGLALALSASFTWVGFALTNRKILKTNASVITVYSSITCAVAAAILNTFISTWSQQLHLKDVAIFIFIGVCLTATYILLARAYQLEVASFITLANAMDIPSVFIFQVSVLKVYPSFNQAIGAVLILFGFLLYSIKSVVYHIFNLHSSKCLFKKVQANHEGNRQEYEEIQESL